VRVLAFDDRRSRHLRRLLAHDITGAETSFGVGTRIARDPAASPPSSSRPAAPRRVDYSRLPVTIGDAAVPPVLGSGVAGPSSSTASCGGICASSRTGTVLPSGPRIGCTTFIELVATATRLRSSCRSQHACGRACLRCAAGDCSSRRMPRPTSGSGLSQIGRERWPLAPDFSQGLAGRFEEGALVPLRYAARASTARSRPPGRCSPGDP